MKIYDLRCDYRREAEGVINPEFFWKYVACENEKPVFRLDIASSRELLEQPDVFSGEYTENAYVLPEITLASLTRYYWRVSCGDEAADSSFVSGVAEGWTAPFIAAPEGLADVMKEYVAFGRTVQLSGVKEGVIAVCSRGYHRLTVNGLPASDGFAPNRSNIEGGYLLYEVYDITHLLREGENSIAVLSDAGWGRKCGLEPCISVCGVFTDAQGRRRITAGEDWSCRRTGQWCTGDYAWGNFGGEHLRDAHLCSPGVPARSIAVQADIRPDRIRRDGIVCVTPAVSVSGEGTYTADMGRNFTGFVSLRLKGEPGSIAVMTVADKPGEQCSFSQRYELEFCGGDGSFINCFNWLSGRYLHISGVSEAPGCGDILAMSVSSVGKRSGFFSGDETLERIMQLDADTFVANTISGVTMDCPHRERLGYGETGCSTTWGVGLPLFDCADLYHGYLPAWASRIESNGHIPHVAPDFWGGGGTQWSNYPVIGLADMLNKYPDKRLCRELGPVLLAYFEFLASQCRDGLLRRYEQEEWGFLGDWATPEGDDWGASREALFFNNCCYAYAITRALEAGIFDAETAHGLAKRHKELCEGINREFYRDGLYCSEHARYQAAAIICGAADSRREAVYDAMLRIIRTKGYLDGGSAGLSLMFRVLAADRRGRSAALKCLRRREYPGYLYFIDHGQTTLPEMWDMRDIYGGSRIHTCYSGASGFIMRGLAGIDFKAGKAVIEPFISSELPEFSAQEDTLWGTLSVECRVSGQRAAVSIWVPSGCAAEFVHEGRRTVLQSGLNRFEQDCAE
ncbi:MAG: alpha-L-rhamnosidase N-terminal domain-containing protein [Firmicutes bacterium]|nr:alpha-L-rhamnosidase N-terminal domain-containing protein [Bacillota bacterium]